MKQLIFAIPTKENGTVDIPALFELIINVILEYHQVSHIHVPKGTELQLGCSSKFQFSSRWLNEDHEPMVSVTVFTEKPSLRGYPRTGYIEMDKGFLLRFRPGAVDTDKGEFLVYEHFCMQDIYAQIKFVKT